MVLRKHIFFGVRRQYVFPETKATSLIIWNYYLCDNVFCSLPHRGSVGDRFFASGWQLTLMKRMKKRLTETADHYRQMAAHCAGTTSGASEQDEGVASATQREFYDRLEKYESLLLCLLWRQNFVLHWFIPQQCVINKAAALKTVQLNNRRALTA